LGVLTEQEKFLILSSAMNSWKVQNIYSIRLPCACTTTSCLPLNKALSPFVDEGKRNVFFKNRLYPITPVKLVSIRYKYMVIQSLLGYVPSHSHEDSLGCQLKRPKPNFLKASLACLLINDIASERIVYLMG
jgi:hypothetical protein